MTFLALVLLACAKANSGATTVLVDELDASRFRMRQNDLSRGARLTYSRRSRYRHAPHRASSCWFNQARAALHCIGGPGAHWVRFVIRALRDVHRAKCILASALRWTRCFRSGRKEARLLAALIAIINRGHENSC